MNGSPMRVEPGWKFQTPTPASRQYVAPPSGAAAPPRIILAERGRIEVGDSRTASAMSVSVICCFLRRLSRCAAIQIVPSGPRLARMYCE